MPGMRGYHKTERGVTMVRNLHIKWNLRILFRRINYHIHIRFVVNINDFDKS